MKRGARAGRSPDAARRLSAILRLALRAFPARFRGRYGEELEEIVEAMRGDGAGWTRRRRVALALDLLRNGLAMRLGLDPVPEPAPSPAKRRASSPILRFLEDLRRDLGYGARMLWRHRTSSAVAAFSLALGIGANTLVFGFLDAVLVRPLPVAEPDSLVVVEGRRAGARATISFPTFDRLERESSGLEGLFAATGTSLRRAAFEGRRLHDVEVEEVSGGFFPTLEVEPVIGRAFSLEDDRPGGGAEGRLAVLSHRFWQERLGGDPDVVGRRLLLGTTAAERSLERPEAVFTIVGVMPRGFFGVSRSDYPDVWVPVRAAQEAKQLAWRTGSFFQVMGRLAPGESPRAVEAALSTLFRNTLAEEATDGGPTMLEQPDLLPEHAIVLRSGRAGFDGLRREFGRPLVTLAVIAAIFFLLACCNVANLMYAQGLARRAEMSTRAALGSGRRRLLAQLGVETLLLSAVAAVGGAFLALVGSRSLLPLVTEGANAELLAVRLDGRTLGFIVATTLLATALVGLPASLRATAGSEPGAMRVGSRSVTGSRRAHSVASLLVVAQLAASLVLVVVSALLLRSLVALDRVDIGIERDSVLLATMDLGMRESAEETVDVGRRLRERMAALPGVESAGVAWLGVFSRSDMSANLEIDGFVPEEGEPPAVRVNSVSPGYFEALGLGIVAGRPLAEQDREDAPRVVVVNRAFEREFLPGGALGRTLAFAGDEERMEIVGVSESSKWNDLRAEDEPMVTLSAAQFPSLRLRWLALRTANDPVAQVTSVRAAAAEVDPEILLTDFRTLDHQVDRTLSRERLLGRLATVYGALGVLLSALGLYGVLAAAVTARTGELGIRAAFGARRAQLVGLVARRALLLAAAGVAVGLVGAIQVSCLLEGLLFGLEPQDPVTLAVAVGVVLVIVAIATWPPAWRATRVDPAKALRWE